MKKILLIGNGAREHIIAEKLKASATMIELYCIGKMKNPGIAKLSGEYFIGDYMDHDFVCDVAREIDPDFVFIGPDDPIGSGLADSLLEYGFKSVAPLKSVASLESSKSFTRNLIEKYNVPGNPKFKVFKSSDGIKEFMEELGGQFVVKYDGLNGGKGVKVVGDHLKGIEDGFEFAIECLESSEQVVVEEKFIGQEFSLLSFSDGHSLAHMPVVQDYKRAHDGDLGPNTGGMGTYSDANHSLPFLTEKDVSDAKAINEAVLEALREETGTLFKGIMYGGFIAVKDGVKVIEYNARFGDPEAMNVLTLLKTDFVELCEAIINERLDEVEVKFKNLATVCVYLVPKGYPNSSQKGAKIQIPDASNDSAVYFGSVSEESGALVTGGSRSIAIVSACSSIEEARKKTYATISKISGDFEYRSDIASSEKLSEKVIQIKNLRS